jgi:hypothetical protein
LIVLPVVLISLTAHAAQKGQERLLHKIKLDTALLTDRKPTNPPEQRVTLIKGAKSFPTTPLFPTDKADCYLVQDQGAPASHFDQFAAGDAVAKYFDPGLYCAEPVYPLKIQNVEFLLYDFAAVGSVDIEVDVHLVCQDSCDGPGTRIYRSGPVTVTTMYPDMALIELPEAVCVWEPFFVSIKYASGAPGSAPGFMFDDSTYACDTCHAWMWYASGGNSPPWWEWHDFWAAPHPGCPIIRAGGFTEHPDCDQAPCDTAVEMLLGGGYAFYYWPQPPNDPFINVLFQMPGDHGGRLEQLEFGFYEGGSTGTPDPGFYVWLSDGVFPLDNNPPYQAIAEYHIDYGDISWFPEYTAVQTYQHGITFDPGEMFHVGVSHALEPGDTLALQGDDGSWDIQSSGWGGTEWSDYSPYGFKIIAYICPLAFEPTFTMQCAPALAHATPGDPPAGLYQIEIRALGLYDLPVTLSLLSVTPSADITATFGPSGVPPNYVSNVTVTVGADVPYRDYTLTFLASGEDGETKTRSVTLRVQPPYDEELVNFYQGAQRATNFGALGNGDSQENFVWYGSNYLYDGTFLIATTDAGHMALDLYDCEHWGWRPTEYLDLSHQPQYGANVAYAHYLSDTVPGEYDSVFIIGPVYASESMSIKIKIYYNPTDTAIPVLHAGVFEDWDVGDYSNNWVGMDTLHNLMYQYDADDPTIVCGTMTAPFYDDLMHSMIAFDATEEIWVVTDGSWCDDSGPAGMSGRDTLFVLMTNPDPHYRFAGWFGPDPSDYALLMSVPPFSLNPGEKHIEIWIDFGRDLTDALSWHQWRHKLLRYAGFYRGDVTPSGQGAPSFPDVGDVIYLVNYLYKHGPDPIPYADQGDVNANRITDLEDVVILLNFIFKEGPVPTDYVRFIPSMWSRPSLFTNPLWR